MDRSDSPSKAQTNLTKADVALDLAGELAGAMTRLRRMLRRATRRALPYEPLPRNQLDLLHLAAERPGIGVAAAAAALALAPNTVSTLVNQLCRAGLLSRRSGVEDRRVAHLTLTAAGRRLATWRDRRAEVLAASLADLSADDRNTLSAGPAGPRAPHRAARATRRRGAVTIADKAGGRKGRDVRRTPTAESRCA